MFTSFFQHNKTTKELNLVQKNNLYEKKNNQYEKKRRIVLADRKKLVL